MQVRHLYQGIMLWTWGSALGSHIIIPWEGCLTSYISGATSRLLLTGNNNLGLLGAETTTSCRAGMSAFHNIGNLYICPWLLLLLLLVLLLLNILEYGCLFMITVFMFDKLMNWFTEQFEKSCYGDAFRPVLFVPFRNFIQICTSNIFVLICKNLKQQHCIAPVSMRLTPLEGI
jgi:hypothetical protein